MHTFRFPLKNVPLLEKWEKAVNNANNSSVWKATHFSHICSNHFTIQDYVIPPSDNGTCRLKHNAVPASFPLVNCPNYGISVNIRQRLESADSVLHDHTYCAKVDGASQVENLGKILEDHA